MVCPACGSTLHRPGFSFTQKHRLETLQHTLADLDRSHTESARRLLTARRNERRTIYRLLALGMLAGTLLLILETLISSGLSLPGLLLLLFFLLLFRNMIPALPGLIVRICRWSAPGDLAMWREEQKAERTRLAELAQTQAETAMALADLSTSRTPCPPEPDEAEEAEKPAAGRTGHRPTPERSRRSATEAKHVRDARLRRRRPGSDPTPHFFHRRAPASSPTAVSAHTEKTAP